MSAPDKVVKLVACLDDHAITTAYRRTYEMSEYDELPPPPLMRLCLISHFRYRGPTELTSLLKQPATRSPLRISP